MLRLMGTPGARVVILGLGMTLAADRVWCQLVERVLYVSVLDRSERPARDVAAEDLIVRENNLDYNVLRVSPATESSDIALLVDTSEAAGPFISDLRGGLLEFVRAMDNRHEIALIAVGRRPTLLVDYTSDTRRLEAGLGRLYAQTGSGAYLMEGIIETSRRLRTRERSRRVLVVITSEGEEFSGRDSTEVLNEVRRSDVVVEAFVMANRPGVSRAFEGGTTRGSAAAAIPDQAAIQRTVVLTEAARMTGGRREDPMTPDGARRQVAGAGGRAEQSVSGDV